MAGETRGYREPRGVESSPKKFGKKELALALALGAIGGYKTREILITNDPSHQSRHEAVAAEVAKEAPAVEATQVAPEAQPAAVTERKLTEIDKRMDEFRAAEKLTAAEVMEYFSHLEISAADIQEVLKFNNPDVVKTAYKEMIDTSPDDEMLSEAASGRYNDVSRENIAGYGSLDRIDRYVTDMRGLNAAWLLSTGSEQELQEAAGSVTFAHDEFGLRAIYKDHSKHEIELVDWHVADKGRVYLASHFETEDEENAAKLEGREPLYPISRDLLLEDVLRDAAGRGGLENADEATRKRIVNALVVSVQQEIAFLDTK